MAGLRTEGTTGRRGRSRRLTALLAGLCTASLAVAALSDVSALAQETDPTTTTEPAPDPTTTTEPAPDPTTTTEPAADPTTTTEPASDSTTTTEPTSSTTTAPTAPEARAGTLDPGEALVSRPEFAALTGHQRALVQELQTATDTYALRRFAQVDLAGQVAAAKDVLAQAQAAENGAVTREILGLVVATQSDDDGTAVPGTGRPTRAAALDARVAAFRSLGRRLQADRKRAQRARVQAQGALEGVSARLAAQAQAVAGALAERSAAESAIEDELGSDAVRARPDDITATLARAQAGEPDPVALGGIGQPIPGAALESPFGLRNDPLGGGAGFHPGFDVSAGSGTPIHAAAAGVVVIAGDCGGYGNCVVLDHGDSLATVYAHQSQVLVSVGEHLDAGQVLGLVGSTGMSTGPHLHFEVRLHGLPIDPVLALPVGSP